MCISSIGAMESPRSEDTGRSATLAPLAPTAPQPNGSNKIIGRNVNGTSKLPQFFITLSINASSVKAYFEIVLWSTPEYTIYNTCYWVGVIG